VILIDQLKEIYIDGELEPIDTTQWYPKVMRKDYTVGLNRHRTGSTIRTSMFYENYACGSERNYTGYCNPEVDKLIDQQSAERHSLAVNLLVLGTAGAGRATGGAQSEHAARDRPSRAAAAVRAAAAGAALGRSAEGAGAGSTQCRDQDQRRLHAVAREFPVQGHLGPARPHLRRLRVPNRCLWGTDWTRAVKLLTYREGVEAFRVTDRLSDSDRALLMGESLTRIYNWSPSKA
jgi:hypothetical protein